MSTINQTVNKTNYTGMSDNSGTASKQEENPNSIPETKSTPKSKSAPSLSSVWVFAIVLGTVIYRRKTKQ